MWAGWDLAVTQEPQERTSLAAMPTRTATCKTNLRTRCKKQILGLRSWAAGPCAQLAASCCPPAARVAGHMQGRWARCAAARLRCSSWQHGTACASPPPHLAKDAPRRGGRVAAGAPLEHGAVLHAHGRPEGHVAPHNQPAARRASWQPAASQPPPPRAARTCPMNSTLTISGRKQYTASRLRMKATWR